MKQQLTKLSSKFDYALLVVFIVTLLIWNLPFGNYILYPFTLLGTWYHEMSHGLMAILMGGDFIELDIRADGSGYASHTGARIEFIGNPIIALAGPIGPAIAGFAYISASSNEKITKYLLALTACLLVFSGIKWISSLVGALLVVFYGILTFYILLRTNKNIQLNFIKLLAVQAYLSIYQGISYFFIESFKSDGQIKLSDTGVVESYWFLPHWFWAIIVLLFSLVSIFYGLKVKYKLERF